MDESRNTKVVENAYAAFLRGDVPSIVASLDDEIVWQPVIGASKAVPTSGTRRGKAEVGEFFQQVAASMQFSRFEPREFVAQGNKVVTLGHYTATTTGGGSFDSDFVMVFTLRDGKVVKFQEFLDSAALNAAFAAAVV
jgi:uncharacterized protein